jgi:hypothetical protein
MPPRILTWTIVVFWLAMTGWMFEREVLPRLIPGGPAPFTVDLARETRDWVEWDVFFNGRTVGSAWTRVEATRTEPGHQQEYKISTNIHFKDFKYEPPLLKIVIQLTHVNNSQTVHANGQLLEMRGELAGDIEALGSRLGGWVRWQGIVSDGAFQPHWTVQVKGLGRQELDTDAVHIPNQYSTLNTLQPWTRLYNLTPGQRWRIVQFDPLVQSVSAMAHITPKTDYLDAGVLQDTDEILWDGKLRQCLVIEYHGENEVAKTFVRESDGLVLRQEVETQIPGVQEDLPEAKQIFALQRKEPPH